MPPLEIPLSFSGTFGEIRGSHFHAGIDLKTKGREGFVVRSVAPGKIARIRVSLSGYGKCVYIQHPNGTTTVYAHLKKLAPPFEQMLKQVQYERESYTVQFYPKGDEWAVDTGTVIGYSGNTGGSLGPHLHFEVRDSKTQEPLNPMDYGIDTPDQQRPILQEIWVQNPKNPDLAPRAIPLQKANDSLWTAPKQLLNGSNGFLIRMFDRQDLSYNKNGIYALEFRVNGQLLSHMKMDRINFNDSKKIKDIIDYKHYRLQKKTFLKLYPAHTAGASFLEHFQNGDFIFETGKSYKIDLKLSDKSGNNTYVSFFAEGVTAEKSSVFSPTHRPELDYVYTAEGNEIYIPQKAFYGPVRANFRATKDTLFVSEDSIAVQKALTLKMEFPPAKTNSKTYCIAKLDTKGQPRYVGGFPKNNRLQTKITQLGTYLLAQDSIAPSVKPQNFKSQQWVSRYQYLTLTIEDDFSGIQSFEGRINGQWVLFEYEPKQKRLTYDFSDNQFQDGKHELELRVKDNCGNEKIYTTHFFRKYGLN